MAKMTPEILTEGLKKICGANIRSVVLYGSAAAGDSVKTSDYNVLVVMDHIGAEELLALTGLCSRWGGDGNHAPLLFAKETLMRSADVFPVEFADIRQTHKVLYGEDPFAGMEIDSALLRLELERELKSKLILLRENFLVAKGSPKEVERLMTSSISAFLTLFKAALRLYGETPPAKKMEVLPALSRRLKFDAEAFSLVWSMKEGVRRPCIAPLQLFGRYLAAIQQVTDAVDLWLQSAENKTPATKVI
ncbi:MAG: nucleotidyltransferase domain-containing protein [Elusimicrobiales bacterium]|jgi:predicted nucleotidyltransferase